MDVKKEIMNLLDGVTKELSKEKISCCETWTKTIKTKFTTLGHKEKYKVAANTKKANYGKWLYDLIWWRCENDYNNMKSIELAVEIAWHPGWEKVGKEWRALGYENDFLKLVYAKARLKLFIFGAKNEKDYKARIKRFKELADMCEDRNGDKYLFFWRIKTDKGYKFEHESYTAKSR